MRSACFWHRARRPLSCVGFGLFNTALNESQCSIKVRKNKTASSLHKRPAETSGSFDSAIILTVTPQPPKRFVIFYHPKVKPSLELAQEMAAHLKERGAFAEYSSIDDEAKRSQAGEADMLIALGGDGTMLRARRTGAFNNQPVPGINPGRLGFLVDAQPPFLPLKPSSASVLLRSLAFTSIKSNTSPCFLRMSMRASRLP